MKTKISNSVNNSYTSILLHLVVTSLNYRKGLQENKRNSKAKFQRKKHRNVLLRDLCKDILHECEDKRGNFLLSFLFKCFTLFTKFPLSNILELPSGFSITSAKINAIPYFFNHSISYLIFHIQCFYTWSGFGENLSYKFLIVGRFDITSPFQLSPCFRISNNFCNISAIKICQRLLI